MFAFNGFRFLVAEVKCEPHAYLLVQNFIKIYDEIAMKIVFLTSFPLKCVAQSVAVKKLSWTPLQKRLKTQYITSNL